MVGFLKRVRPNQFAADLPGDAHDRNRIEHSRRNAGNHIGSARPGSCNRHSGQSAGARIAIRHVGGALLVPDQYVMDLAVLQRVISWQNSPARIAKNVPHPFPLQTLPKDAGPGHRLLPGLRIARNWRALLGHQISLSALLVKDGCPSTVTALTQRWDLPDKTKPTLPAFLGVGWGALAISSLSAHSTLRTATGGHTRTPGILKLSRRRLRKFVMAVPESQTSCYPTRPVRLARGKVGASSPETSPEILPFPLIMSSAFHHIRPSPALLESLPLGADLSTRASSSSVVADSVVEFLKTVPPFQFLPSGELSRLVPSMTLEYFPKDAIILRAGHRASDALYIVHKGAVQLALRTTVGKELVFDLRGEGEIFGLLSLMGKDVARLDVTAVEDALCYSIPGNVIEELASRYPEFSEYLVRASITRYLDRSLKELRDQTNLMGNTERLLYSLAVQDVVSAPVVVCTGDTSIREAAHLATTSRATCLAVVGPDGRAVGIVTDRDFTRRVLAKGLALDLPVSTVMSTPVVSVESTARLFQALLAMISKDIQHVLVIEEGLPKAVLSSHELILLQGKSPLTVSRHLEQQKSVEGLASAQKKIVELLPLLLREGARVSHITRVVSEINDRLMGKILEFAEAELGPPPLPYCFVVLGSEGRREQTFKTDQDNALIFADPDPDADAGLSAKAQEYFTRFSLYVRDALARCGYPPCTGDYMASNPRWRQPLSSWKSYFRAWIAEADLHSVEDALIFFDMRPVGGDPTLCTALATFFRDALRDASFFKSILAYITVDRKPPLGFFRTFVVERSGEHKEALDIKTFGTTPIVNAARLLALDAGIEATNTVDRLSTVQLEYFDDVLRRDLLESFELLTLLRLEHQLRQLHAGQPLSNYVNPETLTQLQRSLLKEAFRTITLAPSRRSPIISVLPCGRNWDLEGNSCR